MTWPSLSPPPSYPSPRMTLITMAKSLLAVVFRIGNPHRLVDARSWCRESTLTSSAILFLVIMVTKPDGTALGYCLFFPKVHVVCLMIIVNARLGLRQGSTTNGSGAFVSSNSRACPVDLSRRLTG